ncbi:MAG: response regulator transcription factor [Bacteroidetes bacterium]|nr:response regulator transcription factor [Bacteroidota bacterium]
MKIKVSLVEDEKEISEGLCFIINTDDRVKCIACYASAEEAIKGIENNIPDVVLVDIHLPKLSGIELITKLKPIYPSVMFLICTTFEDEENIFNALKAGASGYVLKKALGNKLIESIVDVYQGGSPMTSIIARKVVTSFQKQSPSKEIQILSEREKEILDFLAKGDRYKEIAEKLFLSVETVRTHIRNIYSKLQVNSRMEAINKAFNP